MLESACDLLIDSGKVAEARELWKQLGHRQTALIVNGDFATEPGGHGFDWRLARPPGVTDISLPGAHRILFSGKQPEMCELLRQFVVLEPGKKYVLHWEARTRGFVSPTGIAWNEKERDQKARTIGAPETWSLLLARRWRRLHSATGGLRDKHAPKGRLRSATCR